MRLWWHRAIGGFILFGLSLALLVAFIVPQAFVDQFVPKTDSLPSIEAYVSSDKTTHLFADLVPMSVRIIFDRFMIQEDSINIKGVPSPYEIVSVRTVERKYAGKIGIVDFEAVLRCMACLPAKQSNFYGLSFDVLYRFHDGTPGIIPALLPPLRVVSRLHEGDMITQRLRFSSAQEEFSLLRISLLPSWFFLIIGWVGAVTFATSFALLTLPTLLMPRAVERIQEKSAKPITWIVLELASRVVDGARENRTRHLLARLALWGRRKIDQGLFPKEASHMIGELETLAFSQNIPDPLRVKEICARLQKYVEDGSEHHE